MNGETEDSPMPRTPRSTLRAPLLATVLFALAAGFASGQSLLDEGTSGAERPEAEFHMARLAYDSRGCAGSRG